MTAHDSKDVRLLFAARIVRMFAYGAVSVVLALYLAALGVSEGRIGLLLSLTLAGDIVVTLLLTTSADRFGRRRMLAYSALLMAGAGLVFVLTRNYWALLIAAIVGVISPSGNEIGAFLSIEQAALAGIIHPQERTSLFARYNLSGSLATACGALAGGWLAQSLIDGGVPDVTAYRAVLVAYCVIGLTLIGIFALLSAGVEGNSAPKQNRNHLGLGASQPVVLKLTSLFAMDAFGGGFVVQAFVAWWFGVQYGVDAAVLGRIFFAANLLAGFSALAASRIAARIGLIRTMVYTHIPSNILLMAIPFMPTLASAVAVLLLRFSISQMDVPTRQSYVMATVEPDERAAAAGVVGVGRSLGAMPAPALAGLMVAAGWIAAPFVVAGAIKIAYDLLLYREFSLVALPEEERKKASGI